MAIGKVIKNSNIILVDKNFKPQIKEGEMLIGGKQVSLGYINQKKETKKKFIKLNNNLYFRTGDLAKIHEKNLYFIKRIDDQVKFRGHRIELSEINFYLRKFGFNNVYTTIHNDQLISVIQGSKVKIDLIKNFLKKKIEEFKIPSIIIFLKRIPLNNSGKIDTKIIKKYIK